MKRPRGSDRAESCDESDASDPTLLLSLPDEVARPAFDGQTFASIATQVRARVVRMRLCVCVCA